MRIHASDIVGNDVEKTFSFIVDNTPPEILVESPLNGTIVSHSLNIDFEVKDENLAEDDRRLLPGIGIEQITSLGEQIQDEQGEYTEIAPNVVNTLTSTETLLRQCDSCYLAARCPAFKEHSECGFKLPVEIRTKDQLNAAMRVMIEIQASRVLFARFAEELEGQGLDPALSAEMDRLFTLIDKMKTVNES